MKLKQLLKQIKVALRPILTCVDYPNVKATAQIGESNIIVNPNNLFMYGNSTLKRDSVIMNARAKYIIHH